MNGVVMMDDTHSTNNESEKQIQTDFSYAIVAGWLILPAIGLVFSFLESLLFLISADFAAAPFVYVINILFVLLQAVIIWAWIKRKKVLPALMIIIYALSILGELLFSGGCAASGFELFFFVLLDLIWIGYFIRSKRVKATFVYSI